MSIAIDVLKAEHVGIRDFKEHLSTKVLSDLLVITDRGIPVSVNLPYSDMLELVDVVDELSDMGTIKNVQEGRKAIASGAKGVPVSNLFKKVRMKHK